MSRNSTKPGNALDRVRIGVRFAAALDSAAAGLLVAFTVATLIRQDTPGMSVEVAVATPLGGVGGFFSGLLLATLFGQAGLRGWCLALLAAFVSPTLAGAIAGTCLMPGPGTASGALETFKVFLYPASFGVWLLCLVAVHLHLRFLRKRLQG